MVVAGATEVTPVPQDPSAYAPPRKVKNSFQHTIYRGACQALARTTRLAACDVPTASPPRVIR